MRFGSDPQLVLAVRDIADGMRLIRLSLMLGWQDIVQRYRRSLLGPLWLTLSTAVTVGALGLVYASLFRLPLERYLPYLAIGLVTWTFISSLVIEGCNSFIAVESTIKQIRMPFTMHATRAVWRN